MIASVTSLIVWLMVVAAATLLVPVGVLVVQTCGYLFGHGKGPRPLASAATSVRIAVVMPAHNEETVIGAALTALQPQLGPDDRLIVVADNCTDRTAEVARGCGAEVTERSDTTRRGKGYALDWGVRALRAAPPDVVIIVDADCEVAAGALRALADACVASGRPAQARYLMQLPPAPSLKLRVAALAWLLKTQLRPLGFYRLGLPCQLMGTGMAFPWHVIHDAPLASGNIVEDVQLGVDLALRGYAPAFCPQAEVRSWFPAQDAAVQTQRTRWEHGHLATLRTQVPRLISAALRERGGQSTELTSMAWDLAVPPLTLLALLLVATYAANAAVWLGLGSVAGLAISAIGLTALAGVIAVTWHRLGRAAISPLQLLSVPIYMLGKLPMYLRLVSGRRQAEWVRTARKKDPP